MYTQELMNVIYDLLAQNEVTPEDHNHITDLVDHVDTERNSIVFINAKGKEFELQLVDTYAPSTAVAQEGSK